VEARRNFDFIVSVTEQIDGVRLRLFRLVRNADGAMHRETRPVFDQAPITVGRLIERVEPLLAAAEHRAEPKPVAPLRLAVGADPAPAYNG
jgi:hypothetical protein